MSRWTEASLACSCLKASCSVLDQLQAWEGGLANTSIKGIRVVGMRWTQCLYKMHRILTEETGVFWRAEFCVLWKGSFFFQVFEKKKKNGSLTGFNFRLWMIDYFWMRPGYPFRSPNGYWLFISERFFLFNLLLFNLLYILGLYDTCRNLERQSLQSNSFTTLSLLIAIIVSITELFV